MGSRWARIPARTSSASTSACRTTASRSTTRSSATRSARWPISRSWPAFDPRILKSPRRPRCGGSLISQSTSPWSRSAYSVDGTPPTWSTRRWRSSRTWPWTTWSSPGRPSWTLPARRLASSNPTAQWWLVRPIPNSSRCSARPVGQSCWSVVSSSTVSRISWRLAGVWSTCAHRPRCTPICSFRCTAAIRATTLLWH
ncbi:unannotated protein [freshwater metagenome]|uniref:Unannotated protein n=1 Tax=freshwater metagenome TaxID=449393 RepID=A0A6J7FY61_9ZZZZ